MWRGESKHLLCVQNTPKICVLSVYLEFSSTPRHVQSMSQHVVWWTIHCFDSRFIHRVSARCARGAPGALCVYILASKRSWLHFRQLARTCNVGLVLCFSVSTRHHQWLFTIQGTSSTSQTSCLPANKAPPVLTCWPSVVPTAPLLPSLPLPLLQSELYTCTVCLVAVHSHGLYCTVYVCV